MILNQIFFSLYWIFNSVQRCIQTKQGVHGEAKEKIMLVKVEIRNALQRALGSFKKAVLI